MNNINFFSQSDYNLFVSPKGNRKWTGKLPSPNPEGTDGPFPSIEIARDHLRQYKKPGSTTVWIREGRYTVSSPIVFGPEDSAPVTYAAFPGEKPVIDGGRRISGLRADRVNGRDCWVADIPDVKSGQWYFRQLFVNGKRRQRPRLPKAGYYQIEYAPDIDLSQFMGGKGSDFFYCREGDIQQWRNLADIEAVVVHYWNEERMQIRGFDPATRKVTCARKSVWPLKDDAAARFARYWVENVLEALTEPGEWYLDRTEGRLYYIPLQGETLDSTEIFAPFLFQLVKFEGDPENEKFVTSLKLRSLNFEHTDWYLPPGGRKLISTRSNERESEDLAAAHQAAYNVPGVISLYGAKHCAIENCTIRNIGFYGIEISYACSGIRIAHNEVADAGAGGVKVIGGDASDVPIRRTGFNYVCDNEIHDAGHVFPSSVGILAIHTFDNDFTHNHIHHLFYSGISCGWVWGYGESITRNNRIEKNHIHHLGHGVLNDLGGIYTLGIQAGTVLRGNLIHDVRMFNYGGWAIYLDEGTSFVLVENNVCYNTDSEVLQQHYGRENIIRNNILAFSKLGQVSLSRVEEHLSFTFLRNIVITNGKPLFLARNGETLTKRGIISDLNLFFDVGSNELISGDELRDKDSKVSLSNQFNFKQWQQLGYDAHSIIADPGCTNLLSGKLDFSLQKSSPAFELGFVPIDMADVGPRRNLPDHAPSGEMNDLK